MDALEVEARNEVRVRALIKTGWDAAYEDEKETLFEQAIDTLFNLRREIVRLGNTLEERETSGEGGF